MRQVIHGIYLGHINYTESSVIARFYTKEYGKRSFVIKGLKSKKNKTIGLLQPLHELEIVSNFRPEKELNTSFAISISVVRSSLAIDLRKSTVAMFISEVLNKSILEEETNNSLYHFLIGSITNLDEQSFNPNFHTQFLIELSLFLGFYPLLSKHKSDNVFNLIEGRFENENAFSPYHLDQTKSKILNALLREGITALNVLDKKQRFEILDGLVSYYETQLDLKPSSFQSHQILKTVFS